MSKVIKMTLQIFLVQQQEHISLARPDKRARKAAHLKVGHNYASALSHTVGLCGQNRQTLIDSRFGKKPCDEKDALAAYPADKDLLFFRK
jgi:hypothetical protein